MSRRSSPPGAAGRSIRDSALCAGRAACRRLLFIWLAFCFPAAAAAAADPPLLIGVATSLTALEGRESHMAVELAVAEINRGGGVRIGDRHRPLAVAAIDLKDAQADASEAVVVQRMEAFLAAHPVQAVVVGPFRSEILLPAMDVIARRKIPMISTIAMTPAMESKIMRDPKYAYLFRTCLNTRYLADGLIEFMRFLHHRFGFRRVMILNQDVAWARSTVSLLIRLYFERTGWQILGIHHYPYRATDFSAALQAAADTSAQVILTIFDTPHSGELAVQWKARRTPGLLCGFISPIVGPGAWKRFDGQIAGTLNAIFELGNIPSAAYPPATRFYQAFEARYGRPVESGHGPAPAYEAVHLLADAIDTAGSVDAQRLVTALEQVNRSGSMGRLRFNAGHQIIFGSDPKTSAVMCLTQWQPPGRRVIVFPPALAEGEILLPKPPAD